MRPVPDCAVLVPVKAFHRAKLRLADVADADRRAELAQWMAARVLRAADGAPAFVVCDDDAVATWATDHGAEVLWRPGRGLNRAVTEGVEALAGLGIAHVVVAHADLPLAHDLPSLVRPGEVTLVPDARHDGTNVLCTPTDAGFEFSYGAGSFRRHELEARRRGLPVTIVDDERLALDVDTPSDLAHPQLAGHLPDGEVLPWRPTPPTIPASPR
jgi:2-phospho-L-lactate guanylyltransferase